MEQYIKEEFELEAFREIEKCVICKKYCEYPRRTIIINHNHYHQTCIENYWLLINRDSRYKIVDNILSQERTISKLFEMFHT